MSTSTGSPSKKMGWYRSMIDKLNHENKLLEKDRKKDAPRNPRPNKPKDQSAPKTP